VYEYLRLYYVFQKKGGTKLRLRGGEGGNAGPPLLEDRRGGGGGRGWVMGRRSAAAVIRSGLLGSGNLTGPELGHADDRGGGEWTGTECSLESGGISACVRLRTSHRMEGSIFGGLMESITNSGGMLAACWKQLCFRWVFFLSKITLFSTVRN
jgi:hypothetical protein